MSDLASAVVQGVGLRIRGADPSRALPEVIFDVVTDALNDAGVTMDDIDGIVIAAHDLVDGRSLSSMITGPAAGAYLRDEIRVSEDGLVALSLGAARIEAGESTRIVVAAWGRASEGDPERTSRAAFDPFSEQALGMSDSVVSALRASAYLRQFPASDRDAAAAARLRRAGVDTSVIDAPVWPLRAGEMAHTADVAAAVILCSDGPGPRVTGVGHGTDPVRIGDRSLADVKAARDAVDAALAGASRTVVDLDVVELSGRTLFDEVLLLEAAGLATAGQGPTAYTEQARINPSGGAASGFCFPASGLARFVEAVQQVRGTSGEAQLSPRPRVGLVVAGSAVADQTVTAVVVESA
jgi:hypothetical protein